MKTSTKVKSNGTRPHNRPRYNDYLTVMGLRSTAAGEGSTRQQKRKTLHQALWKGFSGDQALADENGIPLPRKVRRSILKAKFHRVTKAGRHQETGG